MALRKIVLMGDPVLRTEAEAVPDEEFGDELLALVNDMFETMYAAEGVGLAAPQIGISRRIFVVDTRDEEDPNLGKYALVNPEIVEFSKQKEKEVEGCLSIPGLEEMVERPWAVKLVARDPQGNPVEMDAEALMARALQHELDHLDGILFPDRVSPLKRRMLLKKWKKLQEDG